MEGNNIQTITKMGSPSKPSFFSKNKGKILKGAAGLLGAAATIGIGSAMGAPGAAAPVFGMKGYRTGRSLLGTGQSLFKKLNPEAKPMKVKLPKQKEIKTAKPPMIKPKKVEVSPEEKAQVMNWYGVSGFKPGASLKKEKDITPKLRPSAKAKATKYGKKMAAKDPGAVMFNYPGKVKEDLDKENTLKLFR